MFSPSSLIIVVVSYMAILFMIAQLVEKRIEQSSRSFASPWVYALSLAVYHTSWTFYGSVGFAASSGLMYLGVYIGALISIAFWWITQRRMIQAKETFRITSIADFISTRYNRSKKIAALVTVIALLGVAPYISLQLKAVISSYNLVTQGDPHIHGIEASGVLTTLMMIAFTIIFGARRLDPTERHQGMVYALVAECILKLLAFLAVGYFATFVLFDGFGDISDRLRQQDLSHVLGMGGDNSGAMWVALIVLSFSAVQFLPRQFHMGVVENSDQNHLKTALWLFPLYIILINIFVVPIAGAGLLSGFDAADADFFVLLLPQMTGDDDLVLLTFLGGFSAATAMVIVSTMTLATMASNHLILPIIEHLKLLPLLRNYLLQIRWLSIAAILLGSYWYTLEFSESYVLVSIGLISFVAVLQFAPAILGGLFWSRGNSAGAFMGLIAGLFIWWYTLILPAFTKEGWFDMALIEQGPFALELLRPEALLGLEGLPPVAHAVFWTLLFNIGFYVIGSLLYQPHKSERNHTTEFLCAMLPIAQQHKARPTGLDAYIALSAKLEEAQSLLANYLSDDKAQRAVATIADDLQVMNKTHITIIELVEFHRMVEHVLAGSIGAASAHSTMENTIRYTEREAADLKALYSHIVTGLSSQAIVQQQEENSSQPQGSYGLIEDLQTQIDQLQLRVQKQEKLITELEEKLEARYDEVFRYRIEAQKATQDNLSLRKELEERIRQNV